METKEKRIETLAEVGHKARREVEDFLNRWFNDSTKGWALRKGLLNRYEDRLSPAPVINFP